MRLFSFIALAPLAAALLGAPNSHAMLGLDATGVSAFTDPVVKLNPRFVQGRKLTYVLKSSIRVPQARVAAEGDEADAVQPSLAFDLECEMRLTTAGVGEDGSASFIVLFPRVLVTSGVDDLVQHSFDSAAQPPAPTPPAPADPAVNPTDPNSPDAAAAPAPPADPGSAVSVVGPLLHDASIRIDVGPDGVLTALEGLDLAYAAAILSPEGHRVLGPFAPGVATRTFAALFRVDSPDAAGKFADRELDDTWTITDQTVLSAEAVLTRTISHQLESLAPELVTLQLTGNASIGKPPEGSRPAARPRSAGRPGSDGGLTAAIVITEQADTGDAEWNPAAGVLLSRVRQSSLTTQAELGTHKGLPQRVESRIEIKLKEKVEP